MSKRIPNLPALTKIIRTGSEGAKEFARIMDLLLFHEAKRNNKKVILFDDSAGDYHGLDSLETSGQKHESVGFQYKFYPSPLSDQHKNNIVKSLIQVQRHRSKFKLDKWILVTPEDFTESGRKNGGGDVSWFESLKSRHSLDFEIEHWGHKQLISLFIEAPTICLWYYPELIDNGALSKSNIADQKKAYDENLVVQNRMIEFVGMSIYKPEASRGIEMEHIYIPLRLIPVNSQTVARDLTLNPKDLLEPGAKSVVLGDPGSGKSTLLKFLSLAGKSPQLQERYDMEPDERLAIHVTLRRYADELKSRKNLSIVDYMKELIEGDFNVKVSETGFVEYYLENGKAILLFDGLDELPDPQFKEIVRNRIRSLNTTFPSNTCIVSSRIVGYENPFRFDEKSFRHFIVSELSIKEMEEFVRNWYQVRIENDRDRNANVQDLLRILNDSQSSAIRDLGKNPLLLTIIVLVHRIDAVLPDERAVLYLKCTETLLNTWQTWKTKSIEHRNKGRDERRNKRRMDAIAHWMHEQSTGTGTKQRSVVPYDAVREFLVKHIITVEKELISEDDADDLAYQFLDFVKKKAGLLVEVGDGSYSFVHLTFQEYLTSSHLITISETRGFTSTWTSLRSKVADPRWHEVVRLLIAGLKSEESQEFLINKILSEKLYKDSPSVCLLLAGILLDGVSAAQSRRMQILEHLFTEGINADSTQEIRNIATWFHNFCTKDEENINLTLQVFISLKNKWKDSHKVLRLFLFCLAANVVAHIPGMMEKMLQDSRATPIFKFLFSANPLKTATTRKIRLPIQSLNLASIYLTLVSPGSNYLAAVSTLLHAPLGVEKSLMTSIRQILTTLAAGENAGPFTDLTYNLLRIGHAALTSKNKYLDEDAMTSVMGRNFIFSRRASHEVENKISEESNRKSLFPAVNLRLKEAKDRSRNGLESFRKQIRAHIERKYRSTNRKEFVEMRKFQHVEERQRRIKANDILSSLSTIEFQNWVMRILNIEPSSLWGEAIYLRFTLDFNNRIFIFDEQLFNDTINCLKTGKITDVQKNFIALHLLIDAWTLLVGHASILDGEIIHTYFEIARQSEEIVLQVAVAVWRFANGEEQGREQIYQLLDTKKHQPFFEACFWRLV